MIKAWYQQKAGALFLLLFLSFKTAHGSDLDALWLSAQSRSLASHPYWLKLLHYYSPGESIGQWSTQSDVVSKKFFLSPDGRTDPAAELKATIAAILAPVGEDPDNHARCRFIARARWLREELDFPDLPEISCQLFERWANIEEAAGMNVIFVSAFLKNPASAFGHILIQFNSSNRYFGHMLLSPTLNFGAITDPQDNPFEYALRGLFGGYDSTFSDERFYSFNHLYGENELRDLWSYPLNFTRKQQDRILYHTWEMLQNIRFTYYFFLDNCAYRMAELIGMAWTDETRLNTAGALWVIPVDVIFKLKNTQVEGGPLLGKPMLIPSRQRKLQRSVARLDEDESQWLRRLIYRFEEIESKEFLALEGESRARVLDALIDYQQYLKEGAFDDETRPRRDLLLKTRSQLPILGKHASTPDPPAPTLGTPPTRFRAGAVYNPELPAALELGIWSSYHDLLGEERGHLPGTEVVTLDLRLQVRQSTTSISSFTLFSIQNLARNPTGIPGDSGFSWHASGVLERDRLDCLDCRHFKLAGGIGKSVSMSGRDMEYASLGLFAETPENAWETTSWGISPRLGLLWSPLELWKMRLESTWFRSHAGPAKDYLHSRFEQRWTLDQHWDMRLEIEQLSGTGENTLALSYYW